MITLNSTILSYNKIKEIEEYKPMLPPNSIYIPFEASNRSFQKFIPDIYDLDKIEFNDFNISRTFTPKAQIHGRFKNFFNTSMIIKKSNRNEKYIESFPNIYTNEREKSINCTDIDYNQEIQSNNIFKKEKAKINKNVSNNLDMKKKKINKEKINLMGINNKEDKVKKNNNNDNDKVNNNDILNSNSNTNLDAVASQKTSLNWKDFPLYEQKSIHSEVIKFNYKNVMRKDPSKENTYIINTSFYKKKMKNFNNKFTRSEINRNSLNSFMKLEESTQEQNDHHKNIKKNRENKKEEILKLFRDSHGILNNSKLDRSNYNSLINEDNEINNKNKLDQNNININQNFNQKEKGNEIEEIENENENDDLSVCEDKKSIRCNNLNNYTFRTGKSSINNIINQAKKNSQIFNNYNKNNIFKSNEEKLKNINIQYNNSPIFNYISNNPSNMIINKNGNRNINIIAKKKNVCQMATNKKYNFDFPKIRKSEYSKDEDNKSRSCMSISSSVERNKKVKIVEKVFVKYENLKKIVNKGGLYNVLTFLDCYDLMCMLKTNKSLIFLINKAISHVYINAIKKSLDKYKHFFDLLKCSLIYTKIKDAIKIDFVINIRFINNLLKKKINKEIQTRPKCYQFIYFYNYFKSMNSQQKLKTKENTKKILMYDYYTYDVYPENYKTPNIYINKEQLYFKDNISDNNIDKLLFIQPILPFKVNDKGIINLEIYSSNNDFVMPSSIKIMMKSFDLNNYLNNLNLKGYTDLRICEYENICFHWKLINKDENYYINKSKFNGIIKTIEKNFKNFFYIQDISYESIGYYIFKINLLAVKTGKIGNNNNGDDFGINIIIRNKNDVVENEIKKNNLLLERREVYEMRVGDTITLYFSTKIKNK